MVIATTLINTRVAHAFNAAFVTPARRFATKRTDNVDAAAHFFRGVAVKNLDFSQFFACLVCVSRWIGVISLQTTTGQRVALTRKGTTLFLAVHFRRCRGRIKKKNKQNDKKKKKNQVKIENDSKQKVKRIKTIKLVELNGFELLDGHGSGVGNENLAARGGEKKNSS